MEALAPTEWTWVLHSSLLIAAIYGRFTKVWSVRNLDVVLLIGLTPALFLYEQYAWVMYSVTALLSLRLIFDCRFTRRARVEPNMNPQGISFLCAAAFIVLVIRVFVASPTHQAHEIQIAKQAEKVLERTAIKEDVASATTPQQHPTTTLVATPAVALSKNVTGRDPELLAMEITALVGHAAIVFGLLIIGYRHFESGSLGLAMAALYLMMPCTAYYVHRVTHVLPAAFLIWAFVFYRRPFVAGSMLAFATGALFSTAFLLPLWGAYYGRKKLVRFGSGIAFVGLLLTIPLLLTSVPGTLAPKLLKSMNFSVFSALNMDAYNPSAGLPEMLRPHFMILFFCVFLTLTIWPRRKHLGHLIAHSAVLVVLAQLWYPETAGVYVLWYLPMLLLVAFRPRLRHLRDEVQEVEATRLAPTVEAEPTRSTVAPSPLRR